MKLFFKIALATAVVGSALLPVHAAYNDAGTDYTNYVTNSWTDSGPAGDALGMVDFLLCVMENSKAATNVNATYSVLIDENICQGESAAIPLYAKQTLTTLRAAATDPYTMKNFFVTGDGMKVVATTSITTGVTTAAPMGVFTMTWNAVSPAAMVGSKGTLNFLANGTMSYIENMTEDAGSNNMFTFVHGTMTPATSSGQLRIQAQDFSGGTPVARTYRYIFDESHAHYDKDGASAVCLDRAQSSTRAYGYQLFTDAGVKQTLSGPFGFKYTVSGTEYNGWAHPNGAWLEGSHASGAFDKPAVITRRSDSQQFNICYDDDWSVNNGANRDDGYDDNTAGLATACGTASDEVVVGLTNADTNVAYAFDEPLEFNAVTFVDSFDGATKSNISGGRYEGPGSSMDLGWQCYLPGQSPLWNNEVRTNGVSNCDSATNWRPLYSLPNGTAFVDSTDATTYRVKAMDAQSELASVNVSNCTDIPVTNAPAIVSYTAADIPTVALTWSDLPTVSAANTIKYIHGVEQQ